METIKELLRLSVCSHISAWLNGKRVNEQNAWSIYTHSWETHPRSTRLYDYLNNHPHYSLRTHFHNHNRNQFINQPHSRDICGSHRYHSLSSIKSDKVEFDDDKYHYHKPSNCRIHSRIEGNNPYRSFSRHSNISRTAIIQSAMSLRHTLHLFRMFLVSRLDAIALIYMDFRPIR